MLTERARKELAVEHCRRMSAGDVDGVLELYAQDVRFEDPVGTGVQSGRDALRAHFHEAAAGNIQETPGDPVAGQDDVHVLIPVTAVMDYSPLGPEFVKRGWLTPPDDPEGKRLRRECMLMLRTDDAGLIVELRAFWGRSDLGVIA